MPSEVCRTAGRLTPTLAAGCKRLLIDSDYLSALHQDNVTMNWEGISSIVPDGIITQKGKDSDQTF